MDNLQFQKSYSALVNPGYITPAQKPAGSTPSGSVPGGVQPGNGDFSRVLQQTIAEKQSDLVFSKHALQRMDSRGIQVSSQLLTQMDTAVNEAKGKGIRDALMISGQAAFIVNIPSRTVVTTMNGTEMKNNMFTNIDGAVIL